MQNIVAGVDEEMIYSVSVKGAVQTGTGCENNNVEIRHIENVIGGERLKIWNSCFQKTIR